MNRREALRYALWAVLVLTLITTVGGGLLARRERAPSLPRLGFIPTFELTERNGARVGARELAGRPYVVDFIFTRCQLACPTLTSRLATIGRGLDEGRDFRRVSISVDPEHDTPAALAAFAEKHGAPATWWFLRGERRQVHELSRVGFRLGIEPETGDPANPIGHSSRFVLVDGTGQIRGYYDALELSEVAQLDTDLRRLIRAGGR